MKQITKQYKLLYFLLILLSLTSALLMTFFSLQLGRILDSISNSNSGLLFHITICVSSILLWFLISCSYSYLKNQYVKKVILDLKRRLLLHYLSREFNQIDNRNHSDFLNNITKNSDLIQENLLIPKISLIANLGSLIMSVVAIIYIEWRLALVFLLLSSITIFLSQIPGKLMTKSTNNYSLQNNHYLSKMTNFINGFEQIKLLNIQSWTQEKIQEISLEFEESRKTYQFLKDLASTTGILLSFGSQLSCMVAGIFFVRNNLLTIGLLVASIQLLNGVFAPLQSILYNKNLISSSKSIIDNIQENLYETNHEIFHKTRTIDCDNISTISISQLHYEIENKILFDHFSYEFKKANAMRL
ncbi:ABC-type multidrug-protein-lipid transport system, ATPase component [Streptococcus sp. ZB199]|nr:ABC-type multidrug-protein-lipid transport system, ATPase component [Streptococcus sp. ZB199]